MSKIKDYLTFDTDIKDLIYNEFNNNNGFLKLNNTVVHLSDKITKSDYKIQLTENVLNEPDFVKNWKDEIDYLTLIPIEEDGATFGIKAPCSHIYSPDGSFSIGPNWMASVWYKIDNGEWILGNPEGTYELFEVFVPFGSMLKLKCNLYDYISKDDKFGLYDDKCGYNFDGGTIIGTKNKKKFYAAGTIMSLLYCDDFSKYNAFDIDNLYEDAFNGLTNGFCEFSIHDAFIDWDSVDWDNEEMMTHLYDCALVKILNPLTFLPARVLLPFCYYNLFAYCTDLINSPVLWAKKIENTSYGYMFHNCTKLQKIYLLAEDLGNSTQHTGETGLICFTSSVLPRQGIIIKSKNISKETLSKDKYLDAYIPKTWSFIDYNEGILETKIVYASGESLTIQYKNGMTWQDWANSVFYDNTIYVGLLQVSAEMYNVAYPSDNHNGHNANNVVNPRDFIEQITYIFD